MSQMVNIPKRKSSSPIYIPWRFYLSIIFLMLMIAGLLLRMIDLTVIKKSFLQTQGNVRSLRTVKENAFRGVIMDRNGNPLAVSTTVFSAWINPHELNYNQKNLVTLSHLLELPISVLQKYTNKKISKDFIYLRRGFSPELAKQIKLLNLPGLYLQEERKRFYPEGEITAHLVGFTNIDDKGQEGFEFAYDNWLSGTPGKKIVIKDRLGRTVSDVQTLQEQKPGHDLVLSIDKRIQYLAYKALLDGVKANEAISGSAVVLDAKTGEILAMVNQPSFNPNKRNLFKPETYRNRAITDTFEPGSTIKAFSIASALERGRYKPTSWIDTSPGHVMLDNHIVRDEHDNGSITVERVLQLSSNVGVTKMMFSIPPISLWSLLHRMGFGELTGIGFPGEQSGSLVQRHTWNSFMLATLAFGYGMSVTPLQLVQAYSVFANHGYKVPVTLLKRTSVPESTQVMDSRIATQMLAMLETVTTAKGATGVLAQIPGYRVAGKTGTSVMVGEHGYAKHHYTSSFVGIAPLTNPRLVVAVIIHNPHGKNYYASYVSAPIFQKIMQGALRIMGIPPDNKVTLENQNTTN